MLITRSREPQRRAETKNTPKAGDSAVRTYEPRSVAQLAGAACLPKYRRAESFQRSSSDSTPPGFPPE